MSERPRMVNGWNKALSCVKERRLPSKLMQIGHYALWLIKVIKRRNSPFYVRDLNDAKKIILSDYEGFSSGHRWQIETPCELSALRSLIHEHSVICDFGIGVGRISKELLENSKNIHVIGVDSSKEMLRLCRQNISSFCHDRLRLLRFKEIGAIPTASVDLIFSIYTLQHIAAKQFETALKELKRILKPGGFFYLLNRYERWVVDSGPRQQWYNDNLDQPKIIGRYFEEIKDVEYESPYMKRILETHFSKLYGAKTNHEWSGG